MNREKRVECPICHRVCTARNIERHVDAHKHKAPWKIRRENSKIGRIGVGKASTEEKEMLRRQRISETMKKNPKAGGLREGSGRGKKEWYDSPIAGKVYLRSTYEKAYVEWLDRNNITWQGNNQGFEYEYLGKKHTYYPDFYLPETNEYVEVKGFKRKNDEFKWKYFPYKLKIIYAKDLRDMGYAIDSHGNFLN